jgi:hypothetical protein
MRRILAPFVVLCALAVPVAGQAAAQKKPIEQKETTKITSTIVAIDHDARLITLEGKKGEQETIYAPKEVRRFDELKVGDKVTFTYTESVVYQVRKPGEPTPPSKSDEPAVVRNPTPKPSASVTSQETQTVTVKSIDMKVPSITIETEDGRTMTSKVDKKANIKGVNPGDRIVVTYTEAILVNVE